ncbi:hypothetical protein [Pusillimonas sp.]|uniref:hypothetical protein n=1 Tax=Pusillimonas sp. TaxID=3040095 RepID=UPI0037C57D0C
MKKSIQAYLGLFGLLFALTSYAAGGFAPGQKLSEAEISELGELVEYKIGKMRVQVMPSPYTDGDTTWLVNSRGIVGVSHNQIMVAEAEPDAQETVQHTQPRPVSVQYHKQTGIMVATYSDFGQAVQALKALQAALPHAKTALPMVFNQQTPQ